MTSTMIAVFPYFILVQQVFNNGCETKFRVGKIQFCSSKAHLSYVAYFD